MIEVDDFRTLEAHMILAHLILTYNRINKDKIK